MIKPLVATIFLALGIFCVLIITGASMMYVHTLLGMYRTLFMVFVFSIISAYIAIEISSK